MNSPTLLSRPTRVRYGVLGFACALATITYLDRFCLGTVMVNIEREFGLSPIQTGWLLGGFALAYSLFEVPSGWLGDVYGPKRTLLRIVLWWSLFATLTGLIWPFSLDLGFVVVTGFGALVVVQFLFGAGEAGAFPNISRTFHNWFPVTERGFAQGAVWMAGRLGGGITALVVTALVFQRTQADGSVIVYWRHVFWIFGVVGVCWCIGFWLWFRDRPEQHPGVNEAELAYINAGRPAQAAHTSHANVPWKRLFTNRNLWILCLMYFCGAYGWYFNLQRLPKYLEEEYQVTVASHGFWLSSLLKGAPLLLGALACLLGGVLTDLFIRRTGNRKWGRRLFGVVGHGVCALCWFAALFCTSPIAFVACVALAAFWNDLTMGSAWASCLDIGGKFSGIVAGCMNTIGNLGGFVAGVAGGMVLQQFEEKLGWRINFISYGAAYVVAVFLWMAFDATKPVVLEDD